MKEGLNKIYLYIGNIIEKINKTLAMRYYFWVMKPYNPMVLYREWERLWRNTKMKTIHKLNMIDTKYMDDIDLIIMYKNPDKTYNEYRKLVNKIKYKDDDKESMRLGHILAMHQLVDMKFIENW